MARKYQWPEVRRVVERVYLQPIGHRVAGGVLSSQESIEQPYGRGAAKGAPEGHGGAKQPGK